MPCGSLRVSNALILVCLIALKSWVLTSAVSQNSPTTPSDVRELAPPAPVDRELAGGESHRYTLNLTNDRFVRVLVESFGIDVTVALTDPSGRKVIDLNRVQGPFGVENFYYIADIEGPHRLEISSRAKIAEPGRYRIRFDRWEIATEEDRRRAAAEKALMEGVILYSLSASLEVKMKALSKYEEALPYFHSVGDPEEEGYTLHKIGQIYISLSDRQKTLEYNLRALPLRRAAHDRSGESSTLNNLGRSYEVSGESRKSIEYYEQSLQIERELRNPRGEANELNNIAFVYGNLGERDRAIEYLQTALEISRAIGDPEGQGVHLNNLGNVWKQQGENQKALDAYNEALPLSEQAGDRQNLGVLSANTGLLYLATGETDKADDYLQRALKIAQDVADRRLESAIVQGLARIQAARGNTKQAVQLTEQSLGIFRATNDRFDEVRALIEMGGYAKALADRTRARDIYQQSLSLARDAGFRGLEANALVELSELDREARDDNSALRELQQALSLVREVRDKPGEAATLLNIARIETSRGRLGEARSLGESALGIVELQRGQLVNQDLRTSFTATRKDYYEFQIDLMMRLHSGDPTKGYDAEAFQLSERARARSLLEVLNEARADIRKGGDAGLLDRERKLQSRINEKAQQLTQLLGRKGNEVASEALEKEIQSLFDELQGVQTQIRVSSPRYAALTQPQPLSLKEAQQLLDDQTVLLEYALGNERSYLWAVTRTSVDSYELPRRSEIQATAVRAYELLLKNGQREFRVQTQLALTELSRMVLSPAAGRLGDKRLLIVSDGALQYIPFAALPAPMPNRASASAQPLILMHEIVNLPSASVLPVLRQETPGRQAHDRAVAIFADPVFTNDDQRVTQAQTNLKTDRATQALPLRSASEAGLSALPRLPFTRQEADAIAAAAKDNFKALDFDASRTAVMQAELSRYRILHFATHGLLNSQHPELSGLVLSLVDQKGQPQDGFLRLHDIYNLNLDVDLVVLSACRTALGKEVNGEGLIGLTRGFMYAGASRVVASLWDVKDEATAELMRRFYQKMLKEARPPAAALREAQISMFKEKRWEAPYYWAGFTLQGM
jgi:CHAT domain-containing protein/tetratricopeptide (TPR) repeat protein